MVSLDEKALKVYQNLNGTRHDFKDRHIGTTFAPMHPLCRSTHYDDIPNSLYDYRTSRKNGETV